VTEPYSNHYFESRLFENEQLLFISKHEYFFKPARILINGGFIVLAQLLVLPMTEVFIQKKKGK